MKNKNSLLALPFLLLLILACANPLLPAGQSPANVETIVASTLSALTASPSGDAAAPSTPQPDSATSNLLPHPIYYLAPDGAQLLQIFRLEPDGKTTSQITSEAVGVEDFDVSESDGSIVYLSNHQLFLVDARGGNRRMIFDAGAQNEINPFATRINSMVFSPDGQTIAFGHKGLNFYSVATGEVKRVLEDQVDDSQASAGFLFPKELYWPEMYFPNGSKLILTLGYYEGASTAIYDLQSGALTRLVDEQRSIICCGRYSLSADGSTLYSASSSVGMFASGLWSVDTASGKVTTLLYGDFDTNPAIAADNPFIAPDGKLYYFHAVVPNPAEVVEPAPLQLVRSASDGRTDWVALRPETFPRMTEALWAPDASFVVIASRENDQTYYGGAVYVIPTDGSQAITQILPFGFKLQWAP